MATLKYVANSAFQTGTLDSTATASTTALVLGTGQGANFPTTGDFWVRVDNEIFKITTRTSDTLYGTGGQDSTVIATHAVAADVTHVIGVSALDQLRGDLVQTGAAASKSAEKAGNLYLPNNGFVLYRDTGAAMAPWGPIFPLTLHDDSGFSWDNQDTATVVTTNGGVYISSPANSGTEFYTRYKSKTGTYTITVGALLNLHAANLNAFAIGWRQSSDGKLATFTLHHNNKFQFEMQKWTNSTTYSANYGTWDISAPVGIIFLRIQDNGTNRICSYSRDGINFIQVHTVSRTDFLTPDQVLYGLKCQNGTYGCGATIISWKEE